MLEQVEAVQLFRQVHCGAGEKSGGAVMVVVKMLRQRGICDAQGDASAGIGSANRSLGRPECYVYGQCGFGGRTARRDGLTVAGSCHVYWRLDGEDDVGKKAAEEDPPDKERTAAA
jgi:hypothetical protein